MNELKRLFPIKMTKKSKFMVLFKDKIELHLKVYDIIFLSEWYEKHVFKFLETKLFKTSDIITWKAKSKDTIRNMYIYTYNAKYTDDKARLACRRHQKMIKLRKSC